MAAEKNIVEVVVGTMVLVVCTTFIWIVYRGSSPEGIKDGYRVTASFERADGIDVGSNVMVSGVVVGMVTDKILDKSYSAIVGISVRNEIQLPSDTSAEIISNGLLGAKYIALIPGASSEPLINNGTIEFTQSSISIEGLLSKLFFGVDSGNKSEEHDTTHSSEHSDGDDERQSAQSIDEDNPETPAGKTQPHPPKQASKAKIALG